MILNHVLVAVIIILTNNCYAMDESTCRALMGSLHENPYARKTLAPMGSFLSNALSRIPRELREEITLPHLRPTSRSKLDLDAIFELKNDTIWSATYNPNTQLLAVLGEWRIYLYDLQKNIELTSFNYPYETGFNPDEEKNTGSIFFNDDSTEIIIESRIRKEKYSFNIEKFTKTTPFTDGYLIKNNAYERPSWFFPVKRRFVKDCFVSSENIPIYKLIHKYNATYTGFCDRNDKCVGMKCHNRHYFHSSLSFFSLVTDYTIEQRMFRDALETWLLIEKPNKELLIHEIINDIALKCFDSHWNIKPAFLLTIWSTFPTTTQNFLIKLIEYKIQKYGKHNYRKSRHTLQPISQNNNKKIHFFVK